MNQIGIKLPKDDLKFLEWYSSQFATPKATLYRDKTLQAFREWKVKFLVNQHLEGKMGFKQFCNLANISLIEGMQLIQDADQTPLTPEILDDYTLQQTEQNIQNKNLSIFKNKKSIQRFIQSDKK